MALLSYLIRLEEYMRCVSGYHADTPITIKAKAIP